MVDHAILIAMNQIILNAGTLPVGAPETKPATPSHLALQINPTFAEIFVAADSIGPQPLSAVARHPGR
ncbi:MAG: hypothetical protein RMJ55_20365, partial [Roseiflexaceae bacterium]|nr:hypothetical protein [Roseiflexaceae bacterium]